MQSRKHITDFKVGSFEAFSTLMKRVRAVAQANGGHSAVQQGMLIVSVFTFVIPNAESISNYILMSLFSAKYRVGGRLGGGGASVLFSRP